MSEDNSSQSETPRAGLGKTAKMALLSGVLGISVGAGLYAFFSHYGNGESMLASTGGNGCFVDAALVDRINAAATGDVAAFTALDRSISVAQLGFKDRSGADRTLADWSGRTVLLNLWATWCAPCRAEMPALDHLQADMGGEQFEVVPVSTDLGSDAKPKKFYSDIGLKHLGFFHDGNLATLNSLKKSGLAFGLPATLLISKKGCVLGTLNGPAEWAGDDAKALIKTAF